MARAEIEDATAVTVHTLALSHTYLISGLTLLFCCIIPLFYFWVVHPFVTGFFLFARLTKSQEAVLEECSSVTTDAHNFVADQAQDRAHIRLDPIFDNIKVFHRRKHPALLNESKQEKNVEPTRTRADESHANGHSVTEISLTARPKEQKPEKKEKKA